MEELRMVRRDDRSLVVASESGEEFRLVVDDTIFAELRALSRRSSNREVAVKPREIQALIREGKSREEVVEITGLTEDDIERYEEPVLAERRYVLERAQAVPVRTGTGEEGSEQFGTVISERLETLGAEQVAWDSWREPENGWMVALEFASHGVDYRAVWGFEHRKAVLEPLTPDAVNLSKQGEVGDRLIPKLRAVDTPEGASEFEAHTFEDDADDTADLSTQVDRVSAEHPAGTPSGELDEEAEFARRRDIEQRAISTSVEEENNLGHTADLLDALRRRRGERESTLHTTQEADTDQPEAGLAEPTPAEQNDSAAQSPPEARPVTRHRLRFDLPAGSRSSSSREHDAEVTARESKSPEAASSDTDDAAALFETEADTAEPQQTPEAERGGRTKRRASIPSWDDILFGTRSDEDPVR